MHRSYRKIICLLALLAVYAAPSAQAKEVTVAGSTTVSSTLLTPHETRIEKQAGQRIRVNAIGSSRGVIALYEGNADLAAISAPLADVVREINSKRPGTIDGRGLVAHEIGATKVAFVVHPTNPVKQLTLRQITDILAGRTRFWSEVGGPDEPINIITEYRGGGIRTLVEKTIGEWGDALTEVNSVQTGPQVIFAVGRLPNALGVASTGMVDKRVHALVTDEAITQPMYLVTRGKPSRSLAKVIEATRSIMIGVAGGV